MYSENIYYTTKSLPNKGQAFPIYYERIRIVVGVSRSFDVVNFQLMNEREVNDFMDFTQLMVFGNELV
ncbi:hypothetical protein C2W64_02038 [Brevibacillus laterosporus]|nr:hypothetical protein [Brevibacillus laterosporus]RAP26206.1 hypothetical protein C2W64_02038 [Brevibacillus laterosporus]